MKQIIWQAMVLALLALRLPAQTSLEFFTNRANALLQPAFGFGVANIPVYSSTNPAIAYSAALHYLLQSAANAYDASTPASNSPSVFRPLFAWSSNTLFIIGYTNVTTDFYEQTGRGFKGLTDPSISSNDNVWSIPWVVGAKNDPPAFNEYCYSTALMAERQLLFVRLLDANRQPITNLPPLYTNQFFIMSISNVFGAEAWNYRRSNFPDGVTIVASNQVSIMITNDYNWGTNFVFNAGTNWIIDSWPGWKGSRSDDSFLVPIFTNVIPLPVSYWSESTAQFVPEGTNIFTNPFLTRDMAQTGWPVHNWMLNITNNVMYGLIDNSSGLVLDFVNLGGFGSSLPITTELMTNEQGLLGGMNYDPAWETNGATDAQNSPMSSGVLYQIATGEAMNQMFADALKGLQPGTADPIFADPYVPIGQIVQNCTWQTVNPLVHYTVEDLVGEQNEETISWDSSLAISLGSQISNSVCSLGKMNMYYNSGAVGNSGFGLTAGTFQLNFSGVNDLPYAVWASTNMLDWSQIGVASQLYPWPDPQPYPRPFQFDDLATTNYPARFYEVRQP